MSNPPPYVPSFSYTGYQAINPTRPLPGPMVDNDLANISDSLNQAITALASVRRSDGALANGIVTSDSLASDLTIGIQTATAWVTANAYKAGNTVVQSNKFYLCLVTHISGVFATDLAAVKWVEVTLSITGYSADQIPYDHTISGLIAANVKTALDEIAAIAARGVSGHLFGLTLSNNVSDATNDIDIAPGDAASLVAAPITMVLAAAMTKRLDASWVAGTNQGGRYSGAAVADTTYLPYVVAKADGTGVDVYLHPYGSTDAQVLAHLQAETGGAAYAHVRRIGGIVRAAGVIRPFVQRGKRFKWVTALTDYSSAANFSSTVALSVPLGVNVNPILAVDVTISTTSSAAVDMADSFDTTLPFMRLLSIGLDNDRAYGIVDGTFKTDTSARLRLTVTKTGTVSSCHVITYGWADDFDQ